MSCGVGHRRCSDPALLWRRHRLTATALIPPLGWEPPYAVGMALKIPQKMKIKFKKEKRKFPHCRIGI